MNTAVRPVFPPYFPPPDARTYGVVGFTPDPIVDPPTDQLRGVRKLFKFFTPAFQDPKSPHELDAIDRNPFARAAKRDVAMSWSPDVGNLGPDTNGLHGFIIQPTAARVMPEYLRENDATQAGFTDPRVANTIPGELGDRIYGQTRWTASPIGSDNAAVSPDGNNLGAQGDCY